jgi:alpha-L-rhamnosidase
MYAAIGGIDLDAKLPGYKRIAIRPKPGGGLTRARAALRSMYGAIESEWRIEGGTMYLDVLVPANTTAAIEIPTSDVAGITEGGAPVASAEGVRVVESKANSVTLEAGAGKYAFEVPSPLTIG